MALLLLLIPLIQWCCGMWLAYRIIDPASIWGWLGTLLLGVILRQVFVWISMIATNVLLKGK